MVRHTKMSLDEYSDRARHLIQDEDFTPEVLKELHTIKRIIDERLSSSGERRGTKKEKQSPRYPTVHDQEGSIPAALNRKREFTQTEYDRVKRDERKPVDTQVTELWDDRCGVHEFRLSKNQQFLANFMNPSTPYNGLLLFHGVGVGKTCSAITVAEQFPTDTKIIVMSHLETNFRNNIFDFGRLKVNPATGLVDVAAATNQCTSTRYMDQIPYSELSDEKAVRNRISSLIRQRYKFVTPHKFANSVRAKQERWPTLWPDKLRKDYSDHVFIIDEAHHLRANAADNEGRHISKALRDVFETSENMKLLLLTATPMYNDAQDIVELLNLLLLNDKRRPVKTSELFDNKTGSLSSDGKTRLKALVHGYVSHMRGDDPFSFPVRLSPHDVRDPQALIPGSSLHSDVDGKGVLIPRSERFQTTVMLGSTMSKHQVSVYDRIYKSAAASEGDGDDQEDEDDDDDGGGGTTRSMFDSGFSISNLVFPTRPGTDPDPALAYGARGFAGAFRRSQSQTSSFRLEYLPHAAGFLAFPHIYEYAPKIAAIAERTIRADGIVFAHARYINYGVLPLAIALEHLGFTRYGGRPNILDRSDDTQMEAKMPPQLRALRRKAIEKRWTYVILTGRVDISPDYERDIQAVKQANNADGSIVKAVLATDKASEGMDLRNIREVHVMQPWFHMQKIEQIVGRSARNCSHSTLPLEKRNVTIYLHAALLPRVRKKGGGGGGSSQESVDLRAYRIAEMKQRRINEVEDILTSTSIDCSANKNIQFMGPDQLDMRINIVSSQGTWLKGYALGDSPPRRRRVECSGTPPLGVNDSDESTYIASRHAMNVKACKMVFLRMFHENRDDGIVFKDVLLGCRREWGSDLSEDAVSVAIQETLDDRTPVQDAQGRLGSVIYLSDKYLFQPRDAIDTRHGIEERGAVASVGDRVAIFRSDENMKMNHSNDSTQDKTTKDTKSRKSALEYVSNQVDVVHHKVVLPHLRRGVSKKGVWDVVIDFVVDRVPQADIVSLVKQTLLTLSDRGGDDDDDDRSTLTRQALAQRVIDSLKRAGVVLRVTDDFATIYDMQHGTERCIDLGKHTGACESARIVDDLPSEPPLRPVNAAVKGYILPPPPFSTITNRARIRSRVVLEPTEKAQFKLMGDKQESSGYVCFQTSLVKSDDMVDNILQEDSIGKTSVLDIVMLKKADKKMLCNLYEIVMRLRSPASFLRPVWAMKTFGFKKNKRVLRTQ